MSQATGYFVRDTLVDYSVLNSLPVERREKIQALTVEYSRSAYIDVRTQLGPDQARRMSNKQRNSITSTACRVFDIEREINQLLKSDSQLQEEATKEAMEAKQSEINRIGYRIRDIENYLQ